MAKLTATQQEIAKMLDQGKTPDQIAQKRKVSTNAIYQQIRRIRAAQGKTGGQAKAKATGNSRTAKRASGGSSRKATTKASSRSRSNTRRQSNVRAAAPATAEDLLRSEIALIEGGLEERASRIAEAEAVIALTREEIAKLEAEKERKSDVLAVLSGEKVAHARPTPKADAKNRKAQAKASAETAQQETAQPEAPAAETAPPEAEAETVATPAEAPAADAVETVPPAADDDAFFDPAAEPQEAVAAS